MSSRTPRFSSIVPILALVLRGPTASAVEPGSDRLDFGRDVRPILAEKCFSCHGPDESKRKAKLRLDDGPSAVAAKAVVPGKPEESELIARILSHDPEEKMPPAKGGKPLAPSEVETLRRWIREGGAYTIHWAFLPPTRPALPKVENETKDLDPVDRFVLARLEREGLSPSPEADRPTLLRRLSLDLIGLPPTPEEVDAFLADARPDAYRRQVERLLASPHYGEKWARFWLDAARYADSDGYEKDKPRQVWFYRDWVIRAFNRDLPYDRFLVEQIAGDLLEGRAQDQIVATGFLRNSMINEEGGVDPEQFRMEAMFDRMDALGKSVLGLTIQCAQCHDHKYDPLTQRDYYRMFAFLNNSDEGSVEVFTPEQEAKRGEIRRRIREIEDGLKAASPDWRAKLKDWAKKAAGDQPEWTPIAPGVDEISTGGQRYLPLPDASLLAQGYAPTKHTVKLTLKSPLKRATALRLELLNDPNLPMGGPGRSVWGTGALSEIEVFAPTADPSKPAKVKLAKAEADLSPAEFPLPKQFADKSDKKRIVGPVAFAIDGKDETAWTNDAGPERRNQPCKAVFVFEKPIVLEGDRKEIVVHLRQNHGGWNSDDNQNCNLGRFRISLTSADAVAVDPLPTRVREIVERKSASPTPAEEEELFSYWRTTATEWKAANDRIEELRRSLPVGASQLVLHERLDEPRLTHLLQRGDFLKPQAAVEPGTPSLLNSWPADAPRNRLGFARWLTSRQAPTTARSIVNRIWQSYFGVGLTSTSEDLGSQGEPPSHPELLDWLAVDLMDSGWSLKALHRSIVDSRTYRQSSKVSAEAAAKDPANRLLARGARVRVDGEAVRDIFLAAGGLLDRHVGGPSEFPAAPSFLFVPPASYGPKIWDEAKDRATYRRALYTFRYRSVPYPALQAFDAPNGDFSCVRRPRSNTPIQALTTLNEPIFVACARALGLTVATREMDDAGKIEDLFRRCVARRPNEAEARLLADLFRRQVERFSQAEADPLGTALADPARPPILPKGETSARLAAWTVLARVVLNLDETITKE